jgi:hypothetical protein
VNLLLVPQPLFDDGILDLLRSCLDQSLHRFGNLSFARLCEVTFLNHVFLLLRPKPLDDLVSNFLQGNKLDEALLDP